MRDNRSRAPLHDDARHKEAGLENSYFRYARRLQD
jgi:hypothetical protein